MRLGGCSAQSFDVLEKNVSQLKCTKIEDWLINHVSLMKNGCTFDIYVLIYTKIPFSVLRNV